MSAPRSYTLAEIAARFGGEIIGEASTRIERVATLANADAASIAFLANPKYRNQLKLTKAGAVILAAGERDTTGQPRIVAADPYSYFARVSQLLNPPLLPSAGIHPAATLGAGARVASSASVGAYAVLGADCDIGENAVIGAGCFVGDRVRIGAATRLHAGVTIYERCEIGANGIVHAGAVIGADGFGIANDAGRWIKVPQIGRVVIGDDVEIGANTTIDRGALEDTVIEDGVKLDNQIQIGHNVVIGAHTAIAACVGVAGSAKIGKHCRIGGAAGILGHLEICDHATISAFSLVTKSIREPGVYTAAVPLQPHRDWLSSSAQYKRLDRLAQRVAELEQRLRQLDAQQRKEVK